MYDYAQVQLLGRATEDAVFSGDDKSIKATFTLALNVPIRRNGKIESKTIYRKIMVLGGFVNYVSRCQEEDGLKGRLINILGFMDDERIIEDDEVFYEEIIRIAPGAGVIKVMDRRTKNE